MPSTVLSFERLLGYLAAEIDNIADPRQRSNATRYSLRDAVLGGFSAFFMQSESFLDYQEQLNSEQGKNNAQSMFGLDQIPSIDQIRNMLDPIAAASLFGVFEQVYRKLHQQGVLKRFERLSNNLLVALDGTQYHSSENIHCSCCSKKTSRNGKVTYSHQALLPVIVAPGESSVISLPPAFITPQDGHEKQDCEQTAAKRWLSAHVRLFESQAITLLGDDLYSRQPMCTDCIAQGFNFIFVCLPDSHKALYDWVEFNQSHGNLNTIQQRRWTGKTHHVWHYRYLNDVPLRDAEPMSVNWCELTVTREHDGQQLYRNSWVTNHPLNDQRVVEVADAGRCRWKTALENHNVLKPKGYRLPHNFGHGKAHLASVLLTLNLLAFLFHTVLGLVDDQYQRIRAQRRTRKGFFQDILALTKYLWFESWQALLAFMLKGSKQKHRKLNTS